MKQCSIILLLHFKYQPIMAQTHAVANISLILLLHFLIAISQTMCSGVHSVLAPVLVLVVLLLVKGVYAQNLFPPVQSTKNFALRQPATTTSTCRTCEVEQAECAPCNNSCPHNGQQLPEPLNLLEVGTLASGVVRSALSSVVHLAIYISKLALTLYISVDSVMCTHLVCFVRCRREL